MIELDLTINLEGMDGELVALADMAQRKAALELFDGLLASTPVDTGRARAGWSMDTSHGDFVPPKGAGVYQAQSAFPPQGAEMIIVYNNVEYIVPLNEGRSKQAPAHFVEQQIARVQAGLR